jgi:hypothetical protein
LAQERPGTGGGALEIEDGERASASHGPPVVRDLALSLGVLLKEIRTDEELRQHLSFLALDVVCRALLQQRSCLKDVLDGSEKPELGCLCMQ